MAIADQLREKAAQRALRAAQSPMVDPLSPAAKPTATLSSESSPSGIAAGTLQDQLKARLAKRQEQGASPTSPTPVANNTPKNTGVSNGGGDSFADQLRERMAKRQAAAAAGSATGFEKFEKKVNVDNSDNQNLSSGSQSQDSSRRMEGSSNNVVAEKPKWKRTEAAKTGNPNLPLKSASASAASSPLIPAAISPLSSTRASVENISRIAHVANVERSSVESSLVQSKLGDENETVSSSKLDKQMGDVRTGGASPKTLKKPASWTGKSNIPKIPVAEIASLRLSSELQSKPDLKVSSGFSLSITGKSLSQKSLDKEKQSNSTSKNASAESLYDKKEIEAPKGTLYPKSAEIAGDAPVAQVQEYVTALGDFTASETGQLSLNSGEMYIRLVNDFGNGWSYGGTIDGLEQGVFPQTFVQPVEM